MFGPISELLHGADTHIRRVLTSPGPGCRTGRRCCYSCLCLPGVPPAAPSQGDLGKCVGGPAEHPWPAYLEEQMESMAPVEKSQKAGYTASVKSTLYLYNRWTLSAAAKKSTKP